MTVVLLALHTGLTLVCGASVAGLVRAPLTPLERVLLSLVLGVILSSAATYALALLVGLQVWSVLAGPLAVTAVAALGSWLARRQLPFAAWRAAWLLTRSSWSRRPPYLLLAFGAVTALFVGVVFAHTVYESGGTLSAGYATVWADWSQHLSTEASFVLGSNYPSHNPLFSGTALLYPFLGDFHSATLMALGLAPGLSLAAPGAVLMVVIALLIVCLARRLGLSTWAGIIAALICVLGGGLGFLGIFADACAAHGFSAGRCSLLHIVTNPGDGISVITGTLHDLPGIIAAQPRAYDGLLTASTVQPFPNMQWYTPLFAWWLPQRTILYGFAAALSILILVYAADAGEGRSRSAFVVAGLLLGIMPLVHVQTLLVLLVALAILALRRRTRGWLILFAVAIPLMLPRLIQLALAPHGSAAAGNAYPWLEPGWMANPGVAGSHQPAVPAEVATAAEQLISPQWWGFWFVNLGFAVPLCAVLLLLLLTARVTRVRPATLAARASAFVTAPLRELFLVGMLVFAVCNLIVFQSWEWDNTKLLVYWYLIVALVVGALATYRWRRRVVRVVAWVLPTSMLLTGTVVMLRLLPWTPPGNAVTGPYVIASAEERELARSVVSRTAPMSVFLTLGRPNDPVLAAAGRTAVMGYYGWLWSYGVDFQTRPADEQTMFAGCAGSGDCGVRALLRKYGIDYAEIDDEGNAPGAVTATVNVSWWAAQGFPVVASTGHITVYDVRGA